MKYRALVHLGLALALAGCVKGEPSYPDAGQTAKAVDPADDPKLVQSQVQAVKDAALIDALTKRVEQLEQETATTKATALRLDVDLLDKRLTELETKVAAMPDAPRSPPRIVLPPRALDPLPDRKPAAPRIKPSLDLKLSNP